jgi:hypothetical protein
MKLFYLNAFLILLVLASPSNLFSKETFAPRSPESLGNDGYKNSDDNFTSVIETKNINDVKVKTNFNDASKHPAPFEDSNRKKVFNEFSRHQEVQGLQEDTEEYTTGDKFKRALTNLWSAPLEVKYSFKYAKKNNDDRKAAGWGILEGVGRSFMRWGAGWLEFFTTPFDWPDEFKAPIYEPARVWDRETNHNPEYAGF